MENDCLWEVTFGGMTTFNLFLANSIILPIDYEKKGDEIEKLRNEYLIYSSTLKPFLLELPREINVKFTNQLVDKTNEFKSEFTNKFEREFEGKFENKIKDEIKDVQKNSVATLAVFSAIALFTVGSIQLFHNIRTVKQAVVFSMGFGAALCLFVLLIWTTAVYPLTISEDKDKNEALKRKFRYPATILGVFVLLATLAFTFLCIFSDNDLNHPADSESNSNIINFTSQQESNNSANHEQTTVSYPIKKAAAVDTCAKKQPTQ